MATEKVKGVVKHIMVAKFKDEVPPHKIDELIKCHARLVHLIPSMKDFYCVIRTLTVSNLVPLALSVLPTFNLITYQVRSWCTSIDRPAFISLRDSHVPIASIILCKNVEGRLGSLVMHLALSGKSGYTDLDLIVLTSVVHLVNNLSSPLARNQGRRIAGVTITCSLLRPGYVGPTARSSSTCDNTWTWEKMIALRICTKGLLMHIFETIFESMEGVAEYVSHQEFIKIFQPYLEKPIVIDYSPLQVLHL